MFIIISMRSTRELIRRHVQHGDTAGYSPHRQRFQRIIRYRVNPWPDVTAAGHEHRDVVIMTSNSADIGQPRGVQRGAQSSQ